MANTLKSKILRISSKDKLSTETHSNFTVHFSQDLALHSVKKITLSGVYMINDVYTVNANNNTLMYSTNGSTYSAITVPEGNYTYTSLLAAITAQNSNVIGSFDSLTGKFTFTRNTTSFKIATRAENSQSTMADMIGHYTSNAVAISFTCSNIINLNPLRFILIRSSKLAAGNSSNSAGGSGNIFSMLQSDVIFGDSIVYLDSSVSESNTLVYNPPRDLSSIDIQITDQDDRSIDIRSPIYLYFKFYY